MLREVLQDGGPFFSSKSWLSFEESVKEVAPYKIPIDPERPERPERVIPRTSDIYYELLEGKKLCCAGYVASDLTTTSAIEMGWGFSYNVIVASGIVVVEKDGREPPVNDTESD
ncbi:hypothetical protein N7533_009617 [Penicillium manginii]|uniref:uncharacterized protein n=1 Tax=Penicillium manginii TaxID=203109 RepID=UPI002548AD16|nr:uncharacterized protein N7533_009617 [Penicillium manginii]KAJ5744747.1 hypothetical protein N7533_009617 [Penicillium manginii]